MYQALIVEAKKLLPHPNADRLQLLDLGGEVVVVGLGVRQGQRLAWFPPDGQLSEEMAVNNDLVKRYLPNGERDPDSGLFEENRRVRATSIRGVKSNGYACDISALAWTGVDLDLLTPGFAFAELNGKPVCNKYYSPATLRARSKQGATARRKNAHFREWRDTAQLRHKVADIPLGSIIWRSLKVHGTSHRIGNVPDDLDLGWRQRLASKLFGIKHYRVLHGSRRVVLKGPEHIGFHGSPLFRYEATEDLASLLPKDWVAYGELVGYLPEGGPIMGTYDTTKLGNEAVARYGEKMVFSYGCEPGECRFILYALAILDGDGDAILLDWQQTRKWAREHGIQCVPQLGDARIYDGDPDALMEWAYAESDGPDLLDPTHVREGVVLRADMPNGSTEYYKAKGWSYTVLEDIAHSHPDFVDVEDAA